MLARAVSHLFQLFLILPATNATSERSFSALHRIKSYLRCTMTQARLNHLMILHYRQDVCDHLDLNVIGNEYISKSETRKSTFAKLIFIFSVQPFQNYYHLFFILSFNKISCQVFIILTKSNQLDHFKFVATALIYIYIYIYIYMSTFLILSYCLTCVLMKGTCILYSSIKFPILLIMIS